MKPLNKIRKEQNIQKGSGKKGELKRETKQSTIADKLPSRDSVNPIFKSLFFINLNLRNACSPLTNKLYKKSGRALAYCTDGSRSPETQTSNTPRHIAETLRLFSCVSD